MNREFALEVACGTEGAALAAASFPLQRTGRVTDRYDSLAMAENRKSFL